jgi:ADP-heptose:LPS heptosyltransferase
MPIENLNAVAQVSPPGAVPQRILIVLLGSIGDVVRALPLVGRLRAAWPASRVAWAIEPKSAPIVRDHPWVDELIVYERASAPWSFAPFLAAVRRGRFDLVIDLQRHLKSGIISRFTGARERLGFAAANVKEGNHWFSTRRIAPQPRMNLKLMQYQAFGDLLGIPARPISFGLEPSAGALGRAAILIGDTPRPRLGIILGSSWPSRVYAPDAMANVIRQLAEPGAGGFFPILIGGPDEQTIARAVEHTLGVPRVLNLAGKTGLSDLPAIFAACDVAFGPDSGPMHIAAAVRCPVVSLWGATAAERSAPWGFAEFALTGAIPCAPCYLRRCPIGNECMRRITPESVVNAIKRAATGSPIMSGAAS